MPEGPGGNGSAEPAPTGSVGNYTMTVGGGGTKGTAGQVTVGPGGGHSIVGFTSPIRSEGGG